MRKKLMKLIDELPPHEGKTFEEALADHLIANGAIVLPCKINTTVYCLRHELCGKRAQDKCNDYCDGWDFSCADYNGEVKIIEWPFSVRQIGDIGKTVFLTREEAEAALAKMDGGNQ